MNSHPTNIFGLFLLSLPMQVGSLEPKGDYMVGPLELPKVLPEVEAPIQEEATLMAA
jgi:hypothetical protein